jgi:hypothetical protein
MNHLTDAIEKLSRHWKKNAVVNNGGDPTSRHALQHELPDFLEELLPFFGTDEWQHAVSDMKRNVLSYAWVLYNHKTVYIESDLILPVCEDIIKGFYQLDHPERVQEIVAQSMVDEAVHTQMSINAANAILKFRKLAQPEYRGFFLSRRREGLLSEAASDKEKRLVALGIACASETLVTDYLDKIASAEAIQPLCREVTAAHANDELAHSSVFTIVLENVIAHLSESDKEVVARSIHEAVAMFANKELDVWQSILAQLGFPGYQAMLLAASGEPDISVYTAGVSNLLKRTGLTCGMEAA